MVRSYLVRYGVSHHVGRFVAEDGASYPRGAAVVIRSARGTELGEVLAGSPMEAPAPAMRAAEPADLSRAREAESDRLRRLSACEAIFRDGRWPVDLIDVEALLDDGRTVLHYLGPHRLDASGLRQVLRDRCGLDVVLEPVGRDVPEEADDPAEDNGGCGSCSSGGGCGTGGGCGSETGGCGGCAVKELVRDRGPAATVGA